MNARRAVSHLDRRDLEDKCLTLMEESLVGCRRAIVCWCSKVCADWEAGQLKELLLCALFFVAA